MLWPLNNRGCQSLPGTPALERKDSTLEAEATAPEPTEECGNQLTCSLQEASEITGLSYDYLIGQSKVANPRDRVPGFKTGKSTYRVIVPELPGWLRRKAGIE